MDQFFDVVNMVFYVLFTALGLLFFAIYLIALPRKNKDEVDLHMLNGIGIFVCICFLLSIVAKMSLT